MSILRLTRSDISHHMNISKLLAEAGIHVSSIAADVFHHRNIKSLEDGISILKLARLLNRENVTVLISHSNPDMLARAFDKLREFPELLQNKMIRHQLITHEKPVSLANALYAHKIRNTGATSA